MAVELNTLASKKWIANYGGVAPIIDITDGVLIGDFAIDTSNNEAWRCFSNTNGSPKWVKSFVEIDIQSIQPTVDQTTTSTLFALLAGSTLTTTGTRTKQYILQYDAKHDKTVVQGTSSAAFYINGVQVHSGGSLYMGITAASGSFNFQPMTYSMTHSALIAPGVNVEIYWVMSGSGTLRLRSGKYSIIGVG